MSTALREAHRTRLAHVIRLISEHGNGNAATDEHVRELGTIVGAVASGDNYPANRQAALSEFAEIVNSGRGLNGEIDRIMDNISSSAALEAMKASGEYSSATLLRWHSTAMLKIHIMYKARHREFVPSKARDMWESRIKSGHDARTVDRTSFSDCKIGYKNSKFDPTYHKTSFGEPPHQTVLEIETGVNQDDIDSILKDAKAQSSSKSEEGGDTACEDLVEET